MNTCKQCNGLTSGVCSQHFQISTPTNQEEQSMRESNDYTHLPLPEQPVLYKKDSYYENWGDNPMEEQSKKCESCLAGFSSEDIAGNCTCERPEDDEEEQSMRESKCEHDVVGKFCYNCKAQKFMGDIPVEVIEKHHYVRTRHLEKKINNLISPLTKKA
jgi:hypothetical protein